MKQHVQWRQRAPPVALRVKLHQHRKKTLNITEQGQRNCRHESKEERRQGQQHVHKAMEEARAAASSQAETRMRNASKNNRYEAPKHPTQWRKMQWMILHLCEMFEHSKTPHAGVGSATVEGDILAATCTVLASLGLSPSHSSQTDVAPATETILPSAEDEFGGLP